MFFFTNRLSSMYICVILNKLFSYGDNSNHRKVVVVEEAEVAVEEAEVDEAAVEATTTSTVQSHH